MGRKRKRGHGGMDGMSAAQSVLLGAAVCYDDSSDDVIAEEDEELVEDEEADERAQRYAQEMQQRRREKRRQTVARHCRSLGIDPTTDAATISKGYRRAALRHHPDKGGATTAFRRVCAAYEALQGMVQGLEEEQERPPRSQEDEDADTMAEHAAFAEVFAQGGIFEEHHIAEEAEEGETEEETEETDSEGSENGEVKKLGRKEMKLQRKRQRRQEKKARCAGGGSVEDAEEAQNQQAYKRRHSGLQPEQKRRLKHAQGRKGYQTAQKKKRSGKAPRLRAPVGRRKRGG